MLNQKLKKMKINPFKEIFIFLVFGMFFLNSCANLPGGDARKNPPDPKLRVQKNLEEGRGFRLMDKVNKGGSRNFEFASSNELWRASLDTIDFMPLASVNYSGGIIITDWYSNNNDVNENVKISIRFLTNEIRSDALNIKIFKKIMSKKGVFNIGGKSQSVYNFVKKYNPKIKKISAKKILGKEAALNVSMNIKKFRKLIHD